MTVKFAITAALLTLAAPALANDGATNFTRDGYTYDYTVSRDADRTVFKGRVMPQNEPFELVVRGRTVRGDVAGRPVSFRLDKPLAPAAIQTASR